MNPVDRVRKALSVLTTNNAADWWIDPSLHYPAKEVEVWGTISGGERMRFHPEEWWKFRGFNVISVEWVESRIVGHGGVRHPAPVAIVNVTVDC